MKRIRLFLALSLVIAVFTACNNDEKLVLKPETNETVKVVGDTLKVYSLTESMAIDPALVNKDGRVESDVSYKVRYAHQNPGALIKVNEKKTLHYFAESFWTESCLTTTTTDIWYDQKAEKLINLVSTSQKERIDVIPIIIFLLLFVIISMNTLGLDDEGGKLIFYGFIVLNLALFMAQYFQTSNIWQATIGSFANLLVVLLVSVIILIACFLFRISDIPAFNKRSYETAISVTVAIVCALRFAVIFEIPNSLFIIVLLSFMSPNLIAWLYMIAKHVIKVSKVRKEKKLKTIK